VYSTNGWKVVELRFCVTRTTSSSPITVKVGAKVTWTNKDSTTHTATADKGAFDTDDIKVGSDASFTFSKAGTFSYHCSIHPTMTAEIIVT